MCEFPPPPGVLAASENCPAPKVAHLLAGAIGVLDPLVAFLKGHHGTPKGNLSLKQTGWCSIGNVVEPVGPVFLGTKASEHTFEVGYDT